MSNRLKNTIKKLHPRGWYFSDSIRALTIALLISVCSFSRAERIFAQPYVKGWRALNEWRLEDAMSVAEKALQTDPLSPQALRLAAEVQLYRGEFLAAWSLLDAARQSSARPRDTDDRIEESSHLGSHFEEIETEHFRVRYVNKDLIVARYATEVLERIYQNIGKQLDYFPAEQGQKISVEIYPRPIDLAKATGLTIDAIETSGTIAVCKFHRLMIISPLAVSDGYSWADTLAHEYLHLVISKKSHNRVPIWLHEGIAKYYETAWRSKVGLALSPTSESLLARAMKENALISFAEMHPSMAKLPSQKAAATAFAEVFTAIEYLYKYEGSEAIPRLLSSLGRGASLQKAFQKQLGMSLAEFERVWKRYLATRVFKMSTGGGAQEIRLKDGAAKEQTASLEDLSDIVANKHARLGELLQLRGHTQAALVEYENAHRRVGFASPVLTYRLAASYEGVGKSAEARRLLERSFDVHSVEQTPSDGRILAARLALKAEDFGSAKKLYRSLRLKNPFIPRLHTGLSDIYRREGDAERAEEEKRFVQLAVAARESQTFRRPAWDSKQAVSLFAPGFGRVQTSDGNSIATPVWGFPISDEMTHLKLWLEGRHPRNQSPAIEVPAQPRDRLSLYRID